MKNENTLMYQLTETSLYMMSFVIITREDNAIVIDGGRALDMPLLKKHLGGRHISAWILTHAHGDHISGFISEMEKDGCADFDIERVYYNFPPYELIDCHDMADYDLFRRELESMLPSFNRVLPKFKDKAHIVKQGEQIQIDEVKIHFIYTFHDGLYNNLMNDSSLVFKVSTPNTSVMFLGDLGPEGGDILFHESRHLLKADMVQMAHHGHMNCGMEVYAAIGAKTCLWCCADWLYDEMEELYGVPKDDCEGRREKLDDLRRRGRHRMYGTTLTRQWMDILGVTKHYVTKDGTNKIIL